jgi:hypothetical protein
MRREGSGRGCLYFHQRKSTSKRLTGAHTLFVNPLLKNFRTDSRYQPLAKRIGILP